jgi:hypothetical protein
MALPNVRRLGFCRNAAHFAERMPSAIAQMEIVSKRPGTSANSVIF